MSIPEGFTLPQPASYLRVSEETVRRNIGFKRLKALGRGDSVVHTMRCPFDLRQHVRSQDWSATPDALGSGTLCCCTTLGLTMASKKS